MTMELSPAADIGFTSIPILDLPRWRGSDDDRVAFADSVRDACHEIGFFYVVNHDVEDEFVASLFETMKRFFALPLADKQRIDKIRSRHFRGWEAVGAELTNGQPDMREQIDLAVEHTARAEDVMPRYLRLHGPNQTVPEELLPGHDRIVEEFLDRMGGVARELMGVLSVGLGLTEDHIERLFGTEQFSLAKLIRYPATPADTCGVGAHHDAGFLTVLLPGETPGLQVQNHLGDWVDAPQVPGAFLINLGEMLQAMTGNYFVATPHRVITADERYSAAYFHGPSLDTPLAPLPLRAEFAAAVAASPRHASAGFMARRHEIEAGVAEMAAAKPSTYGEQLWNYYLRSYPDNVATHYPA